LGAGLAPTKGSFERKQNMQKNGVPGRVNPRRKRVQDKSAGRTRTRKSLCCAGMGGSNPRGLATAGPLFWWGTGKGLPESATRLAVRNYKDNKREKSVSNPLQAGPPEQEKKKDRGEVRATKQEKGESDPDVGKRRRKKMNPSEKLV